MSELDDRVSGGVVAVHAAECHGSLILHSDGTLRVPFAEERERGAPKEG